MTERVSDGEGTSLANENFSRLQDGGTRRVSRFGCSTWIQRTYHSSSRPSGRCCVLVMIDHCCRASSKARRRLSSFTSEVPHISLICRSYNNVKEKYTYLKIFKSNGISTNSSPMLAMAPQPLALSPVNTKVSAWCYSGYRSDCTRS